MKHTSKWYPSASLEILAKSEALQERAPKRFPRRAPGAPSYAMEGGTPWTGAYLGVVPPETPTSCGLELGGVFFFLGTALGRFPLLLSRSSTDASWKGRSREHTASFSSQGTVMTPPLPDILRTLYPW